MAASHQSDCYNYESNEAFSRRAVESLADAYNTCGKDSYVCAICKSGNAHRIKTKIICENTGCLDIDLKMNQFSVEQVMQAIE